MSIVSALIGPVSGLLSKVITDKDEAAKLAHQIATMSDRHAQEAMLAQIAVNKAEAQGNWFQASWRPLCGYVCVLGLATNFLISPIAAGFNITIPQADMSVMMPVLLGMLGLATARSYEKVKGVSK
mgnify:CR=1 FL=1|tara:strand:+ start:386 stop:763 length:378 start_codon:yes stop_codon:yes gene_type:complete